jgi:hypothetical protein
VLGHLYRYPHPEDPTKFLYCGQGLRRDKDHRSGKSSFGRRFKKLFPDIGLPQPIRSEVEVVDQENLNTMETAWMVLYQTLHLFGGMNLTLPGSDDYKNMGRLGSMVAHSVKDENGKSVLGVRLAKFSHEHGVLAAVRNRPGHQSRAGKAGGLVAVESGQLASYRTPKHQAEAGHIGGRTGGRIANDAAHQANPKYHEDRVRGTRRRNELYGTPPKR